MILVRAVTLVFALVWMMYSAVSAANSQSSSEMVVLQMRTDDLNRRLDRLESLNLEVRLDRLERVQEESRRQAEIQRQLLFGLYVPVTIMAVDVIARALLAYVRRRNGLPAG